MARPTPSPTCPPAGNPLLALPRNLPPATGNIQSKRPSSRTPPHSPAQPIGPSPPLSPPFPLSAHHFPLPQPRRRFAFSQQQAAKGYNDFQEGQGGENRGGGRREEGLGNGGRGGEREGVHGCWYQLVMPERRSWSEEEDRVLRELKEERGEKKWSLIARKMREEFGLPGRSGKQCRERYHNHLDATIVRTEWTREEEELLFGLHEEVGNKWSVIAVRLPGRSDNCVKNHFYSRLRKAVRRLNKLQPRREIKLALLYKLIETTEQRFKDNSRLDELTLARCAAIKNTLFRYADAPPHQPTENALLADLLWFDAKTRKPGKHHKGSTETNYPAEGAGAQERPERERAERGRAERGRAEERRTDRIEGRELPFYLIFKRVCEEVLLGP